MLGISSSAKERIHQAVEDLFDKIALQFLHNIPKLNHRKFLTISTQNNFGLPHLFVQSLENMYPNHIEQDVLKGALNDAYGYIEALKNRSRSNISAGLDGLIKQAKANGDKVDEKAVDKLLADEMEKAKSHFKAIAETEGTKARNVGHLMKITRMAAEEGEQDPLVMFLTSKDAHVCEECKRLHLLEDGTTPKVWKLSELSQGYHKRGDSSPSILGAHPNCRCSISYIGKKFGFNDKGHLTYKGADYDELENQRKKS